jgi:hypothetical protein
VDVVHPRPAPPRESGPSNVGEDFDPRPRRLHRRDVGIQSIDRSNHRPELRVAEVGVDLCSVRCARKRETERTHGPLEVVCLLGHAQWQQFPQRWLVDLDNSQTCRVEVSDLVSQ